MDDYSSYWLRNRHICDVLREMRECFKTYNFSYLPGLIEEAQSMANRMESALEDRRDFRDMEKVQKKLKNKLKEKQKELEQLEEQIESKKRQSEG